MGYYTDITLKLRPNHRGGWGHDKIKDFASLIKEINNSTSHYMEQDTFDMAYSNVPWGDFSSIIYKLSTKYPDLRLTVEGKTEEGNYWIEYIEDGKYFCGNGRIVYDEYDEEKMIPCPK